MTPTSASRPDELFVRVLGGVELRPAPEQPWVQPPPQQRVVAALLVADLGQRCSTDRLVRAVWSDDAPAHATRLLQGLISRLRRVLARDGEASMLRTVPGGWRLELTFQQVDAPRFEALAHEARRLAVQGDTTEARHVLEDALALWRGQPFGDLVDHDAVTSVSMRLEEEMLSVREHLLELRLRTGSPEGVVADARALVASHPLRERAWALLLRGLWQSHQRAQALDAYGRLRDQLVGELGTEPGRELQRLHAAILRDDPTDPTDPTAPTEPADRTDRTESWRSSPAPSA